MGRVYSLVMATSTTETRQLTDSYETIEKFMGRALQKPETLSSSSERVQNSIVSGVSNP